MNCSADRCKQGTSPKNCERAVCGFDLHRIPADEEDTPVIGASDAMGWLSWVAFILFVAIVTLFALMNLPIVAWIFA